MGDYQTGGVQECESRFEFDRAAKRAPTSFSPQGAGAWIMNRPTSGGNSHDRIGLLGHPLSVSMASSHRLLYFLQSGGTGHSPTIGLGPCRISDHLPPSLHAVRVPKPGPTRPSPLIVRIVSPLGDSTPGSGPIHPPGQPQLREPPFGSFATS
jgi:hypothetical protein